MINILYEAMRKRIVMLPFINTRLFWLHYHALWTYQPTSSPHFSPRVWVMAILLYLWLWLKQLEGTDMWCSLVTYTPLLYSWHSTYWTRDQGEIGPKESFIPVFNHNIYPLYSFWFLLIIMDTSFLFIYFFLFFFRTGDMLQIQWNIAIEILYNTFYRFVIFYIFIVNNLSESSNNLNWSKLVESDLF